MWSILKPSGFNKDIHLGWRFAADELKRMDSAHAIATKRKGASQASNSTSGEEAPKKRKK